MYPLYTYLNYLLIDTAHDSLGAYKLPYIIFNSTEAAIWLLCSLYIMFRWLRTRIDHGELYYGLSFLLFGISDVIETSGMSLLLLLLKGACILAILGYRKQAMTHHRSKFI